MESRERLAVLALLARERRRREHKARGEQSAWLSMTLLVIGAGLLMIAAPIAMVITLRGH